MCGDMTFSLDRESRKWALQEIAKMTDIVLHDIDPRLAERIKRIGAVRGWDMAATLLQVLRQGLHTFEDSAAVQLGAYETGALEQVPCDPGFAMIGRAARPAPAAEPPDQSIAARFALK
jgi:hypothetical protein